jgi:3'5'-cyclic nucleotide phosphodiesterase
MQLYDMLRSMNHPQEHSSKIDASAASKGQEVDGLPCGRELDFLAEFACALGVLVQDVDHQGVTNAQLVKERSLVAINYRNQAVSEQNALDIAWSLFMSDEYGALRSVICETNNELLRLRQLLTCCVLVTGSDLTRMCQTKWEDPFLAGHGKQKDAFDTLKDTDAVELLAQVANVAHTTKHWNVYLKWNERLFLEIYRAYLRGRADKTFITDWSEVELRYFDDYVIPLLEKLISRGILGKIGEQILINARANREEWARRGSVEVVQMLTRFQSLADIDSIAPTSI